MPHLVYIDISIDDEAIKIELSYRQCLGQHHETHPDLIHNPDISSTSDRRALGWVFNETLR